MPEVEKRDPRVDPRSGDVLLGARSMKARKARTVYQVDDDGLVRFQIGGSKSAHWWGIQAWREWAATATVIRTAEESTK